MKRKFIILFLLVIGVTRVHAQIGIGTVLNETVGRIIRAIDLEVQKAQNKTIWLQNAQKAVENQLQQMRLTQIAGVGKQQTDLFTKYYNELYTVKSVITDYEQVRNITLEQEALVREYQSAW